jgi:hypothetical protein
MAGEPVSRILRLGSEAPFEQTTYRKQRTYTANDVNCVKRARITGTRWTHLLCSLSLLAATVTLLLALALLSLPLFAQDRSVPFTDSPKAGMKVKEA